MNGRRRRRGRSLGGVLLLGLWILSIVDPVQGDGGRIAWSGERDGRRAAVIVSPVAPRVGVLRIDWVGAANEAGTVEAVHELDIRQDAGFVKVGDEWHASLELFVEGRWTLAIDPDGAGPLTGVTVPVEIGPPIPAWRTQWPWLLAWIPMLGVGLYASFRRRLPRPTVTSETLSG